MSDYTITTDFSVKDALPADDPDKLILGAEIDVELDAAQVAIATKYDSSDIATQVQAEAGTSNAVLMTPLRTAQYLADSGGSGAGIVPDLLALTDPGADRILFWDDSVNAAAYLSLGTGLSISGTVLSAAVAGIDHDTLLNYDANDHIDHTTITITAGVGLSYSVGGTDISADATVDLDINSLTEELTIVGADDTIAFYDDSAATIRKAPIDSLVGDALGDGKWYRNATQSVGTTESTIVWNTEDYDSLTRGTFSTVTGEYTVGASAARIWIYAHARVEAMSAGGSAVLYVQVDGVNQAFRDAGNLGKYGSASRSIDIGTVLSLAAGEVVRVRITNADTKDIAAGLRHTHVSIIELA